MILYRPVGLTELEQTAASGFRAFPPRPEHQPIFYAVLDRSLAEQIASDWNANDPESSYVGYVVAFSVDDRFLAAYTVHTAGRGGLRELWIPASDVGALNAALTSTVQVVADYHGRRFTSQARESAINGLRPAAPSTSAAPEPEPVVIAAEGLRSDESAPDAHPREADPHEDEELAP